jgi:two-component system sensor histidine kinase HydH
MPIAIFEEIRQFVGFDARDAANLAALRKLVEPQLPRVIDRFYREVQSHAGMRQVLTGGPTQMERLKRTLLEWLQQLMSGPYDADYWRERARVGRTHVRINLPQHYMFAGMEIIWQELRGIIEASATRGKQDKLASLHKLLTIEIAVMLESYRESYSEQVRQVERDAMTARLREAEQLAQVGQLAASLAHEVKNPLAGISGAIQVMRTNLKPTDPHWPVLGEVLRQINRLDRSVKDLLVFARPKPPQYQRCDVPRTVERVLDLLRKEPEFERIRFEYSLPHAFPTIAADEHQLEQLLMNLLLNAAQASAPGGVVRLSAAAHDSSVQIVVQDRGCGMTGEVLRRAFEPFYTTKARGTGLGLPICRKIVEAHGGTIGVQSSPGQGTTVTVELLQKPPQADAGSPG